MDAAKVSTCAGSGDSGQALNGTCDVCGTVFIGKPLTIPEHDDTDDAEAERQEAAQEEWSEFLEWQRSLGATN